MEISQEQIPFETMKFNPEEFEKNKKMKAQFLHLQRMNLIMNQSKYLNNDTIALFVNKPDEQKNYRNLIYSKKTKKCLLKYGSNVSKKK